MAKQVNLSEQDQKLLASYVKHQEFMKAYNARPERKAARTAYNAKRWQRMKSLAAMVKEHDAKNAK